MGGGEHAVPMPFCTPMHCHATPCRSAHLGEHQQQLRRGGVRGERKRVAARRGRRLGRLPQQRRGAVKGARVVLGAALGLARLEQRGAEALQAQGAVVPCV